MLKKITTVISANRKPIAKKVIIIGGSILGIGIGLLANKPEDLDFVILEERTVSEEEVTFVDDGEEDAPVVED
jgi:hypothetical protein